MFDNVREHISYESAEKLTMMVNSLLKHFRALKTMNNVSENLLKKN